MPVSIVVVDDDPSVCRGIARLLRAAGYAAEVYSSAEDALGRVDLLRAACWVVDVHMAGISGIRLASLLREAGVRTPVLFMTAHDEDATRDALRAAGDPVCLRKPFSSEILLGAIANALAGTV
jgi:FixJ family two-component response regulator